MPNRFVEGQHKRGNDGRFQPMPGSGQAAAAAAHDVDLVSGQAEAQWENITSGEMDAADDAFLERAAAKRRKSASDFDDMADQARLGGDEERAKDLNASAGRERMWADTFDSVREYDPD